MATCPTCRTRYDDSVRKCGNDGETLLPDEAFSAMDADLKPDEPVGEYRVQAKLGEGGFGAVYRAVHPLIGKTAAIKVLSRQYSSNPQMVSRFISEARAVNQIRHKNIIDIFSFGSLPDGRQYFVMELLDGMPFDRYLEERKQLRPEEAVAILKPVAKALEAAHARGIVHRDLKPENIFLVMDEEGGISPKLLDFGIAKLTGDMSGHKTRTGTPMGTPHFMSPEQCRGQQNIDHRTDVYSFGVMCHLVLTGKLPFDAEAVMDILVKQMTEAPPRLSLHAPFLNPLLDEPLLRMLQKDPDMRTPSIAAAFEDLCRAANQAGYPVAAPQDGSGFRSAVSALPADPSMRSGVLSTSQSGATLALGQAKTIASSPDAGKTFLPQEAEVAPQRKGMSPALVGLGAGGVVILGLLGAFAFSRRTTATTGSGTATTSAFSTPTPMLSTSAPPSATATPTPSPPKEVEVTVSGAPKGATVHLGDTKLGAAPGPVRVSYSTEKVTLVVKAVGFVPNKVEITPQTNTTVSVTLQPQGVQAVHRDLEGIP